MQRLGKQPTYQEAYDASYTQHISLYTLKNTLFSAKHQKLVESW